MIALRTTLAYTALAASLLLGFAVTTHGQDAARAPTPWMLSSR